MASLRFEMYGEWDLGDLDTLAATLKLTYAYFYWSGVSPTSMPPRIRSLLSRYFWTGDYIGDRFAEQIYWEIPLVDRVQLKSIEYHSPGWIEIAGVAGALGACAAAVTAWIDAADRTLGFIERVENFFRDRKLQSIPKKFSLSDLDGRTLDEARKACFEAGEFLGMERTHVENIIDITGNPISALRMLMVMAGSAKKTGRLSSNGKLKLPK